MPDEIRKQKLIAELATARTEMGAHLVGVRRGFSLVERVKHGVRHNPAVWFGGAILAGLLLSKMGRPKAKVVKVPILHSNQAEKAGKAAVALTVLKFALDFAKPALMRYVHKRLADGIARRRS